jgi:cardiolipin synthase A/B
VEHPADPRRLTPVPAPAALPATEPVPLALPGYHPDHLRLTSAGYDRLFAQAMWRIAAAEVTQGNRVELLTHSPGTFDTMIGLIDGARASVALEGYIFRSDVVGQRFADALIASAERGVDVRLLVDWWGRMGTPLRFFRHMRERGVMVRLFNPPGARAWLGLVPRDHRKLLVVDDAVGVTGGVGIGTEWRTGTLALRRQPRRDTAARIEGPATLHMAAAFERMWLRSFARIPRRRRTLPRRELGTLPAAAPGTPAASDTGAAFVAIVEGEPGRLRVARALQVQAVSAARTIWIAMAYFVPSFAEVEALTGAARDGVDVRILVPGRYDHFWLSMMTRRYYNRLLKNGVRIWEWRGEMMHAKTQVIDCRWTSVGSTDFNPLGIAINYELDAMIDDPVLGARMEALYLEDLEQSEEITAAAWLRKQRPGSS